MRGEGLDKKENIKEFSERTMKIVDAWMLYMKESKKIVFDEDYSVERLITAIEVAENRWYPGISPPAEMAQALDDTTERDVVNVISKMGKLSLGT